MALITGTTGADVLPLTDGDTIVGEQGHDTFVFDPSGGSSFTTIADFGSIYFRGPITGAQEVVSPPVVTTASGTIVAHLLRGGTALQFTATVTGIDFTGSQTTGGASPTNDNLTLAHLHDAPAGSNGGVVYGFIGAPLNDLDGDLIVTPTPGGVGGTVWGEWDAGEGNSTTLTAKIPDLLNDEIYINFHTVEYPGGEIRGQLIQQDDGLDRIDVSAAGIGDWATMQILLADVNGGAQFTVWRGGESHTVRLDRVAEANLNASDFIFSTSTASQFQSGTSSRDDLFGAGGNDTISGGAADDRLFGEAGNDDLLGGSGNDTLVGGNGNDEADGGSGRDSVAGGEGNDTLLGGSDNDTVAGGNGDDRLDGGSGLDWLTGGNGDDWLAGGSANDTLDGGAGNDTYAGGSGADAFVAGTGADVIVNFEADEGDQVRIANGTLFTLNEVAGSTIVDFGGGNTLTLQGVSQVSLPSDWFVYV